MARGRRRSTRVEDRQHPGGRQHKAGRRATNAIAAAALLTSSVADRKDRGFDRGAVPTLSLPVTALPSAMSLADGGSAIASAKPVPPPPLAPHETPAEDDEKEGGDGLGAAEAAVAEPLSRESIKAASRSKLAQRARRDKSVHHAVLDVEGDGFS